MNFQLAKQFSLWFFSNGNEYDLEGLQACFMRKYVMES